MASGPLQPDPPIGSSVSFGTVGGFLLNLAATVEPDADHDGFGDETQDQCATDGTTQGPCPVAPKKQCKHKKKHKGAAVIAKKCKKKHHH